VSSYPAPSTSIGKTSKISSCSILYDANRVDLLADLLTREETENRIDIFTDTAGCRGVGVGLHSLSSTGSNLICLRARPYYFLWQCSKRFINHSLRTFNISTTLTTLAEVATRAVKDFTVWHFLSQLFQVLQFSATDPRNRAICILGAARVNGAGVRPDYTQLLQGVISEVTTTTMLHEGMLTVYLFAPLHWADRQ
jgi:hypothetical protein